MSVLFSHPLTAICSFFLCGVIFINGWTDAPNAIATCIATRALSPRAAITTSALFNFLGVLCMTKLNTAVVDTIYRIADFGKNPQSAVIALCAALLGIILWTTAAWYFGIPTSESHALIAGVSGAALALNNSFDSLHSEEWKKVLIGLLLSTAVGFVAGWSFTRLTAYLFRHKSRIRTANFFKKAEIFGGAVMSFMHGAQDGQKFIGVFLLLSALGGNSKASVPISLILLCSALMASGTSAGGLRIIKAVGLDMVRLQPYQGFSADLGSSVCLLFCSLTGIPVSTTHTKTSAIMGAGAAYRRSAIDISIVRDIMLTWILTFPCCAGIGWLLTKLFLLCT